ncbi:hypothetical protein EMIT0P12_60092 [Pseudomonas sp. IT-P12]
MCDQMTSQKKYNGGAVLSFLRLSLITVDTSCCAAFSYLFIRVFIIDFTWRLVWLGNSQLAG